MAPMAARVAALATTWLALSVCAQAALYKVCDSAHGCCLSSLNSASGCTVGSGYRLYIKDSSLCLNGLPMVSFGSPGANTDTGETFCLGQNVSTGPMFNYMANNYNPNPYPGGTFTVRQSGATAQVSDGSNTCTVAPDDGVPCCTFHGFFKVCVSKPGTTGDCHGLRSINVGRAKGSSSGLWGIQTCLLDVDPNQPEGSKELFAYLQGNSVSGWGDSFSATPL